MADNAPLNDADDADDTDDVCCCCGRPAFDNYADRDDMPSCGRPACELRMQQYIDYDADAGDR